MFPAFRIRRSERPAPPPPDPYEVRRAGIADAKLVVRRKSGFNGWLQSSLLRKHALTDCGCGLINCR